MPETATSCVLVAPLPRPLIVRVEADLPGFDASWMDDFARGMHLRLADGSAPPSGSDRVRIRMRAIPADERADGGADGETPEGTLVASDDEARLYRAGAVWRWEYPHYSICVQGERAEVDVATPAAERGAGEGGESTPKQRTLSALRQAILVLLPRTGRPVLHGAALCPPGSREALLLIGPTASGKSTLAAGLLRRGWQCLSDDLLVLSPRRAATGDDRNGVGDASPPVVSGLVRGVRLDAEAGRRLGLGDPDGHAAGDDKAVWQTETVRSTDPPSARPRRILFPNITGSATSRLRDVEASDAVRRVQAQMQPSATLPPAAASDQLDAAAALVRRCSCAVLASGTDLRDDPGALADLAGAVVTSK